MRWLPFIAISVLLAPPSWALEGAPAPAGTETTIADYRLWVPHQVESVRGVIAVSNHEAGSAIYYDNQTWGDQKDATLGYRDLAARLNLALFLFKKFEDNGYDEGHQGDIFAALDELAQTSGHPEIEHAGIIPTGLSAGGFWSGWLAQYQPQRVLAYFPIAGAPPALVDIPELLAVPALYVNQGADGFYPKSGVHVLPVALAGRAKGAVWGGIITPPAVEHHHIFRHDFMIVWLEDVLQLRLPAVFLDGAPPAFNAIPEGSGWLVDMKWHDTNGIAPVVIDSAVAYKYADYPGDKSQGYWMPSQRTANAYVDYVMNDGHLSDTYAHGSDPLPPQVGGSGNAGAGGSVTGGSSSAGASSAAGSGGTSSTGGGSATGPAQSPSPDSSTAPASTTGTGASSPNNSSCAVAAPGREPTTPSWAVLVLALCWSRARRRRHRVSPPRSDCANPHG